MISMLTTLHLITQLRNIYICKQIGFNLNTYIYIYQVLIGRNAVTLAAPGSLVVALWLSRGNHVLPCFLSRDILNLT